MEKQGATLEKLAVDKIKIDPLEVEAGQKATVKAAKAWLKSVMLAKGSVRRQQSQDKACQGPTARGCRRS